MSIDTTTEATPGAARARAVHTVAITIDPVTGRPRITFACHGDRTTECHHYPDLSACECESTCPHPRIDHAQCWMQGWFDHGDIDPNAENLAEFGLKPGMAGRITYTHQEYYLDWRFTDKDKAAAASTPVEDGDPDTMWAKLAALGGELEIARAQIDALEAQRADTIVLCGSMRFFPQMLAAAARLSVDEDAIVIAPFQVVPADEQGGEVKTRLDALHRRKIDLAGRVVVVTDESGYWGESTRSEIEYARATGKPVSVVRWPGQLANLPRLTGEPTLFDETGDAE